MKTQHQRCPEFCGDKRRELLQARGESEGEEMERERDLEVHECRCTITEKKQTDI